MQFYHELYNLFIKAKEFIEIPEQLSAFTTNFIENALLVVVKFELSAAC